MNSIHPFPAHTCVYTTYCLYLHLVHGKGGNRTHHAFFIRQPLYLPYTEYRVDKALYHQSRGRISHRVETRPLGELTVACIICAARYCYMHFITYSITVAVLYLIPVIRIPDIIANSSLIPCSYKPFCLELQCTGATDRRIICTAATTVCYCYYSRCATSANIRIALTKKAPAFLGAKYGIPLIKYYF